MKNNDIETFLKKIQPMPHFVWCMLVFIVEGIVFVNYIPIKEDYSFSIFVLYFISWLCSYAMVTKTSKMSDINKVRLIRRICHILYIIVLLFHIIYPILFLKINFDDDGYYHYKDSIYYNYGEDWYYYDYNEEKWKDYVNSPLEFEYLGKEYKDEYQVMEFEN